MNKWLWVLASAATLTAIGCDKPANQRPSFAFSRPEHLAFVCFAPNVADPRDYTVLPTECCRQAADPSSALVVPDPNGLGPAICGVDGATLGEPVMHALVSQSTRGEIAAVDVKNGRVLDSDRLIPGFTFLDTGGLPSAVVVPTRQPHAAGVRGPEWTFVASAEEFEVRAIATCRFRSGRTCGPETRLGTLPETVTRVALPAAPEDMVLGPDGALWVSLPALSLIARIDIAETPAGAEVTHPFPLDEAQRPREPQFYPVVVSGALVAPEPVRESEEYLAVCGLTAPYTPVERKLPIAPRAPTSLAPRPTTLRFDGNVLLVGDRAAPALHAFALGSDSTLTSMGALATGAPIRDFVVTAPVPALSVLQSDTPGATLKRYVYAIDDRDQSLMAFEYALDGAGQPRLIPLLAPVPSGSYADRIAVTGPVTTLDVIDTRSQSSYACGDPVAPGADLAIAQDLLDDARPNQLRGVFVVTAAASGTVSFIDVLDLDVACRSFRNCANPVELLEDDSTPVAIRRHTPRRRSFAVQKATTASGAQLVPHGAPGAPACPAAFPIDLTGGKAEVCGPADPWSTAPESWVVRYRQPLPGGFVRSGILQPLDQESGRMRIEVPAFDLCARGVQPGDLVAVLGTPLSRLPNCERPTAGDEPLLRVLEARRDHLVVEPVELQAPATPQSTSAELLRCYPEFVSFEVRAGDFLVVGEGGVYLHNIAADPNTGSCLPDPEKSPLFTARLAPDGSYQNPFVSFRLGGPQRDASGTPIELSPASRNTSIAVAAGGGPIQVTTVGAAERDASDALPATVRYVPELDRLFVLDTASQGLRRFALRPLAPEGTPPR